MAEAMETVVIMRDDGFTQEDQTVALAPLSQVEGAFGVDLDPGADLAALAPHLERIALIRVRFGAFADGRGFTVARRLRAMGYGGRLRAAGPLLADQYAMARRAGFDEVEVAPEIALRQPEAHWLARADWRAGDHQSRLRG
jgi:uncharacterized protein (DUF934 family)